MELFRIDTTNKALHRIDSTRLSAHGFTEPKDLEAWVLNPDYRVFGSEILWIFRQDSPTAEQRSDLIGVDEDGDLVVCELKRGIVSEGAVTQALRYAAEYARLDLPALAKRFLENVQGRRVPRTDVTTVEEAQNVISKVVTKDEPSEETPVNEGQRILLVGEDFDAATLSIVKYLNEGLAGSPTIIECWRLRVYSSAESGFLAGFEQLLPQPDIRAEIDMRREEALKGRYARDPGRNRLIWATRESMASVPTFRVAGTRGSPYTCRIILEGAVTTEFTLSVHSSHPRLSLPVPGSQTALPSGLGRVVLTDTGASVLEFPNQASDMPPSATFIEDVQRAVKSLAAFAEKRVDRESSQTPSDGTPA